MPLFIKSIVHNSAYFLAHYVMPSHTAKSYTVNTGSIKRVNKREKMQSKNSRSPITGPISLSVAVRWDD